MSETVTVHTSQGPWSGRVVSETEHEIRVSSPSRSGVETRTFAKADVVVDRGPCTTPTAHRADECNGYHLDGSDV